MRTEQGALRVSLVGIVVVSATALAFGWWSGSTAILFDGVFSLADAVMSVASIWVATLVARSAGGTLSARVSRRFNLGFWHLEPILLAVNAVLMMGVAAYAVAQSIQALLTGGRDIDFGPAVGYAAAVTTLSAIIAIVEARANRRLRSALVSMDVKGWIMSGGISAALLIAFIVGLIVDGTDADWILPYIDPAVLLVVGLVLIPVPIGILRGAVADLLYMTPLDEQVAAEAAAARVVAEHGFVGADVIAAKMGRSRDIEVLVHVAADDPPRPLAEWDAIRAPLESELGADDPHAWVRVTFTTR